MSTETKRETYSGHYLSPGYTDKSYFQIINFTEGHHKTVSNLSFPYLEIRASRTPRNS